MTPTCEPCAPVSPSGFKIPDKPAPEEDGSPDADHAVETAESAKGGSGLKERLMTEATSVRHLLTHLPKNPCCPVCQAGKLVKNHHRRKTPNEDSVTSFGEKCTADTLYAHGERSQGRHGEKYAVVLLDLGTDWCSCEPCCERSSKDAAVAMRAFAGPDANIKSFYSDSAKELVDVAREMSW